jgi:hypothetical protein
VQMFQTGYPIFRSETVDFLLEIEREEREKAGFGATDITDVAVEDEPEIIITPIFPNLQKAEESQKPKGENFRITDENLGIGGAKEKFKNNIAAIKLLKEIENNFNRIPTKEEQEILSKYVGWGGITAVIRCSLTASARENHTKWWRLQWNPSGSDCAINRLFAYRITSRNKSARIL